MIGKSKKNTFCQLTLVQLIRLKNFNSPPGFCKSATKFVYFFDQSDSLLKPDFTSSIVPRNISAVCQKFCTFFPLYFFFRIFLSDYCSLVVKVSFVPFFWKLRVGFEVNFTFEFVIYTDMVERVSFLPKYYVCIRRACTCVHVTAKARLIFAYIFI